VTKDEARTLQFELGDSCSEFISEIWGKKCILRETGNKGRHNRQFEVTLSGKIGCRCYIGELISCCSDDAAGSCYLYEFC
jgi:hypothetical protein